MDPIIELLKKHSMPVNRRNYLEFAYAGTDVDIDNLDPEQDAMLPEELQKNRSGLLS